jgi:TPR repeat protein
MASMRLKEVILFDMASQFNPGLMYADGRYMDLNNNEAMRWYQMAANEGFALAQNKKGCLHVWKRQRCESK